MEDLSFLRRMVFASSVLGPPVAEYTVNGNPVSFATNVSKPLSVLAAFTPAQAGSGDPSPENVRPITGFTGANVWKTGVNVWDEETELGGINSSTGQEYPATGAIRAKNYIPVVPGVSYYIKAPSMTGFTGCWYDKDKNYISTTYQVNSAKAAPNNAYFFRFGLPSSYGTTYGNDISFNYPSTDTEYHPYTGQSYPVTFPALGKNLFDKNGNNILNAYISTDEISNIASCRTVYIPCKKNTTYTVSKTAGERFTVAYTKVEPGNGIPVFGRIADGTASHITITTGEDAEYLVAFVYNSSYDTGTADEMLASVQIEEGETATAYEPYTNTVYGGTIDLTTGVLTVTHAMWKKNTADMNTTNVDYPGWIGCGIKDIVGDDINGYVYTGATRFLNCGNVVSIGTRNGNDNLYLPKSQYDMTKEEWVALAIDVQFVAPLATPLVYQLTPTEILSLIGDNTLWSDLNGDLTVTYKKKG